jgi:succinyl-diaminopimelate desuccinylase
MEINNKLLNITKDLISFKSISPFQDGSIDYIEKYLKNLGFVTTRHDRNDTTNLIARFGDKSPIFAFAGHVDVVPTGEISKWTYDPFVLSSYNNRLYGRGIGDMKGAIAAFMFAVNELLKKVKSINGSIMLLITSDEEAAATDGTTIMVEYLKQNNITLDYCLVGEPTSVDNLGDVIKVGRRGSLTGHLEVIGLQGHIAYPELCKNPIHLFANALKEITSTKWDDGNEFFPATSLQFANLNSGLGVDNVIPDNLFASFNFRYNNLHTSDSLIIKVEDILNKHNLKYNIRWRTSAQPFYTKPGRLNKIVVDTISEELKIIPQLKTDGGTSDGRFLVDVSTEVLEFGLSNKYIHQINENMNQNDLFALAKTYTIILDKIFND